MSYTRDLEETAYQAAEKSNSWFDLTFSPYLLFRWQYKHPTDVKIIAKLASHRLDHHKWCTSSEDCRKIDEFIAEHSGRIAGT